MRQRNRFGRRSLVAVMSLLLAAPVLADGEADDADAAAEAEPQPVVDPTTQRPLLERIPIRFGGYIWVDSGLMDRDNGEPGEYDQNANYMQGRFVLGAAYEHRLGSDWFALGKVEFLALVNEFTKSAYEPHTLDAFLQVGNDFWDVQLGRFLAWEVYQRGQGIELYTAEESGARNGARLYLLDYTRGHKNEAGQAAIHVYPFDFLGIEIAGVYGQESDQNNLGLRPVANLKLAGFELIGGYEFLRQTPQTTASKVESTSSGFAGRAQYTFRFGGGSGSAVREDRRAAPRLYDTANGFTLGVDYAQAAIEYVGIDGLVDTSRSYDKRSMGAFADVSFWNNSIGLGYHRTLQDNQREENNVHHQAFLSYLYRLPIDGLSAKAVLGFARAQVENIDSASTFTNELRSVRVRLIYEFK